MGAQSVDDAQTVVRGATAGVASGAHEQTSSRVLSVFDQTALPSTLSSSRGQTTSLFSLHTHTLTLDLSSEQIFLDFACAWCNCRSCEWCPRADL